MLYSRHAHATQPRAQGCFILDARIRALRVRVHRSQHQTKRARPTFQRQGHQRRSFLQRFDLRQSRSPRVLDHLVRLLQSRSAVRRKNQPPVHRQRSDRTGCQRRRIQEDCQEIFGAISPHLPHCPHRRHQSRRDVCRNRLSDLCGDRPRRKYRGHPARRRR